MKIIRKMLLWDGEKRLKMTGSYFEPSHASARINSAYFSGQPIDEADFTEGRALWRQQGGFVCRYIDTMLPAGKNNHLSIIIE